ncbi:hypothetical protein GQ55_4G265200 [Panicum hallii var. hallii]|jgi:small subunit ribosomal protein S12|uniref:Uncharacterized protein n=3 Tax=Paniceae TaxID=147428 RepID=A0A2T7E0E9_9POAL|nr:hypothetical protein GQ55_4G265200 [Panicum hallii var. hallii]PVH48106.1 hypothetical protein PAHAL_4G251800 [Panicum hallii]
MESVQLEHENVTQLVLVSLRDGVEEGRRLSNEEKDPFEIIERGAVHLSANLASSVPPYQQGVVQEY